MGFWENLFKTEEKIVPKLTASCKNCFYSNYSGVKCFAVTPPSTVINVHQAAECTQYTTESPEAAANAKLSALQNVGLSTVFIASNVVLLLNDTARSTSSQTPVKLKEITVGGGSGIIRTVFSLEGGNSLGSNYAHGMVYRNGVPYGTLQSIISPSSFVQYTQDLYFAEGDLFQVYAWCDNPTYPTYISGQEIWASIINISSIGTPTAGY